MTRPTKGMPLYTPLPSEPRVLLSLLNDLSDLQYWFYMGGIYSASERPGGLSDDHIVDGQRAAQQAVIRTLEQLQSASLARPAADPGPPEWLPVTFKGRVIGPVESRVRVDIRYSNGRLHLGQPKSALREPYNDSPNAAHPKYWCPSKPRKDPK